MARPTLTAQEFREHAYRISDFLSEYLEELPELPAFPAYTKGNALLDVLGGDAPEQGSGAVAFQALDEVFRHSRPNSPRFFGYVFGSGEPVAALGDFAASVLNQNVTAWRSAPSALTIERTVVRWMGEAIGCYGFSGSLTGGGSMANLMALCMAREAKVPANQMGAQGGVIYTSSETHMSVAKAAAVLGIGYANVRVVPVDECFRMRIDLLREAVENDRKAGKKGIAVIGSAGTTATGSIDPLEQIADVCKTNDLWFHVDGAYGAFAAMVAPNKFKGIERADSVSLDPHKWLYQPADCGCLLYRDASAAQKAFSHSGEYVKALSNDPVEGFAFFEESVELSRRFRALKLWLSIRYHGMGAFREAIAEDLRLAQVLADAIQNEQRMEVLAPVQLSAVCFRLRGRTDAQHAAILKRVIERGRVYISNASIGGRFALRACVVNHRTTEQDVLDVISEVLAADSDLTN